MGASLRRITVPALIRFDSLCIFLVDDFLRFHRHVNDVWGVVAEFGF